MPQQKPAAIWAIIPMALGVVLSGFAYVCAWPVGWFIGCLARYGHMPHPLPELDFLSLPDFWWWVGYAVSLVGWFLLTAWAYNTTPRLIK